MGSGGGPLMLMKDSMVSVDFKCFRKGVWGHAGRGPTNDDEGFFVSADFKCFRKGFGAEKGAH